MPTMNRSLHQFLVGIAVTLLLLSATIDVVAYFKGDVDLQMAGLWALIGCVVSCTANTVAHVHGLISGRATRLRRRLALPSIVLTAVAILLALWRWLAGPAAVSSFDGGYPVLVAFALLLAAYQIWLGSNG